MKKKEHGGSKKQRRSRVMLVLFTVGLFLEISGFFVGCADNISFVLRIVSPHCAKAVEGLQTLKRSKGLQKEHRGFDEVASIALDELFSQNPTKELSGLNVVGFSCGRPVLGFGREGARLRTPLMVRLSNGEEPEWNLESLADEIEDMTSGKVFWVGAVVFFTGVVVQVVGFIVEREYGS